MRTALRYPLSLRVSTISLVTVSVFMAFARSNDSATKTHDHLHHNHFAEFAKVPERARARPNPLESDPDAVAAGNKLFAQHCAECHGKTAEGGRKAPNLRAEEVQNATPGTLFWILTNGVVRRGMPVWSKLPEPERWQLVSFLKSLPPSTNMEPHPGHAHTHLAEEKPNTDDQH